MKLTHRLTIVLLLCLAGAVLAGSLLLQHHGESSAVVAGLCGEGGDTGCDRVNQSAWSTVAGVPWAAIGLVFYLSILAATSVALAAGDETRSTIGAVLLAILAAAVFIDVGLFVVQAARIGAFCKLCLLTYAVNVAALAVLWPLRSGLATVRTALATPALRVAIVGWLLATVVSAGGAAAFEVGLRAREAQRAAKILGERATAAATPEPTSLPTSAPTPELPVSGAASPDVAKYQEQLKATQEEVKRLKETLDDPQKYEVYQSQKSLADFAKNPVMKFDLADTPMKGPANAKIKIVEFSDFLCPWCQRIAQAFHGYLPHTDNRVAIYYKFYPLDEPCNPDFKPSLHPGSCWLAYGGVCAQKEGKFWEYHDRVFAMEPQKTPPDRQFVAHLGAELGMNESTFNACLGASTTQERVAADVAAGKKTGIKGTPSIFINGRKLPRTNEFLQAMEEESKRLGLGPMPQVP
jgi:protein-disulfide isomerase/uncharacterized membrane protein